MDDLKVFKGTHMKFKWIQMNRRIQFTQAILILINIVLNVSTITQLS